MRGLCKLIANVSKERGEKKQPWQPEPGGPRFGLQRKPVSTLGGRIRRNWEKNTGKASRGVSGGKCQATASASSCHTTSQFIVRDMICNIGGCEGFVRVKFLHHYPLPPAPGCSPVTFSGALLGKLCFSFEYNLS